MPKSLSFQDYRAEWDPALFKSEKTGRGPLRKDKDFKDDNRAFGSWVVSGTCSRIDI